MSIMTRELLTNLKAAKLLRSIAAAYKLKSEDRYKFKIIAYEKAADAIEHASSEIKDIWDENKLEEIPGVGKSIAEHLDELFRTGRSRHFEEILKGLQPQIFDLMVIPGIGVKTAYKLVEKLNIGEKNPLADLEKAINNNEIEKLEGFGKESQEEILKSLKEIKGRKKRLLLPYAKEIAEDVNVWLKKDPSVKRTDVLGSLRRNVSTVGDIDIAVSSDDPQKTIEHFVNYPKVQRILEKGSKTASIILPSEVQVDLMVQGPRSYGSLVQHFTGSKHHNIALREYALKKNLSLSEYGIKNLRTKKLKNIKTEEELYNALGLSWIPPELREDTGEIKAARYNNLPKLIELSDVKADLQIHSDFDTETSHDLGLSSMEQIVDKANSFKYEYIAFTEHNPSRGKHKNSEIIDLLKRKKDINEQLNSSYVNNVKGSVIYVFNSLEIDILSDGNIPLPDEAMDLLDFALVSIHSSFRLNKEKMTKRVISALSHPKVKIFAHPTGRKLGFREGIELEWENIFDFCLKNKKFLEINADPMRLDLPDFLVKEAVKKGVKLSLGTDAHHKDHMDNMIYAVSVARRGWAEKGDVINSLNLKEFKNILGL